MSRRIGRWTYNSDSTYYGEAGWHLDGGPVVLDFMPGLPAECPHSPPCRGEYQLHGWPREIPFATACAWDFMSIACRLRDAMRVIEGEWDEHLLASLAGIGTP